MNTFLGGLQRASAWGSGGVQGPHAALTAMDRQRQLEQADTLAMQQNMVAMKAQSEARQRGLANLGLPGYAPQGKAQAGAQGQQQAAIPTYLRMIKELPDHIQPLAFEALGNEDLGAFKEIMLANEKTSTPDIKNLAKSRGLSGDELAMFQNQVFKDAMANRTAITDKGEIPYTPTYAPLPPGMRGPATPPPATGGGVDLKQVALNAGIPESAIISTYRDPAKQLSLIDRPDPNNPGKYLTKEGKSVALPGQSAHQIPGAALDLSGNYKITPVQKQALLQAGAVEIPGHPGHYELPMSKINAALAANATAPATDIGGFDPRSKQGQEMVIKGVTADDESIRKSIQEPLLVQNKAEKDLPSDIDRTLSVLDKTRTGPGASTAKLMTEIKGFFKDLSEDELQGLINAKTIEQTQAKMVASGIKGAYGAQLSDKEGDRFIKTLFTLDDPKDFIRATLELKKASVYANRDLEAYLLKHPTNKSQAYERYNNENNGARTAEIMKKYAPFVYAKMQAAEKAAADKSAAPKTIARQGIVQDPKSPNNGKTVIEYSDGTREYK